METSAKRTVLRYGTIAFIASLFLSVAGCGRKPAIKLPYYTDASFTPQWQQPAGSQDHHIAPFQFRDQQGRSFTGKEVSGRVFLANFFFTSCKGICPKMLVNMRQVYRHFYGNPAVLFLSHSVTPEQDSVPRLRQYAAENDITGTQWHLLTGDAKAIYTMARRSYFVEATEGLSKDETEFLHTENLVLVDRNGRIRGIYNGTLATEVPRIIEDINGLLAEK